MSVENLPDEKELHERIVIALNAYDSIGARVVKLRRDRNLRSKSVAGLIGMQAQNYSKLERGGKNITTEQAIKLSVLYQVSLDYILIGSESEHVDKKVDYEKLMEKYISTLEDLNVLYKKLHDKDKE